MPGSSFIWWGVLAGMVTMSPVLILVSVPPLIEQTELDPLAIVSVTGLIGFVGLVVPHALRRLVGPDHRVLVPVSMLAGGANGDNGGAALVVVGLVLVLAVVVGNLCSSSRPLCPLW